VDDEEEDGWEVKICWQHECNLDSCCLRGIVLRRSISFTFINCWNNAMSLVVLSISFPEE
jgi:hypothetical protein